MHLSTIDNDNDYLKHLDKIFQVIEKVRKLSFIAESNHVTTWPGVNGLAKNSIFELSDRQFRVPKSKNVDPVLKLCHKFIYHFSVLSM